MKGYTHNGILLKANRTFQNSCKENKIGKYHITQDNLKGNNVNNTANMTKGIGWVSF